MFALKYYPEKKIILVSQNGRTNFNDFHRVKEFLEIAEKYHLAKKINPYNSIMDRSLFDKWLENFESISTFTQSYAFIRGVKENNFPKIRKESSYINKMKLLPYPFQKLGATFLVDTKKAILADEMGLGKTPQSLYALIKLFYSKHIRKAMYIGPNSIKYQYYQETAKFTNLSKIIIDGDKKKREKSYRKFMEDDTQLLIVNYESVRNDIKLVRQINVQAIVMDEAHRLKNGKSKLYKAISQLIPEYRFALTGTPSQNSPQELFWLAHWVNPDILGKLKDYRKRYIVYGFKFNRNMEIGYRHLDELHKRISQIMLRRKTENVLSDLPNKHVQTLSCKMSEKQALLYRKIEGDQKKIQDAMPPSSFDPITGEVDLFSSNRKATKQDNILQGYRYLLTATSDDPRLVLSGSKMGLKYKKWAKVANSSKLNFLIRILEKTLRKNNKVIIFSQFTNMLDLIQAIIQKQVKENPYRIDGSISPQRRNKIIKTAQRQNAKSNILLMSDAGNFGLNLQSFNVIINYDQDWNPAIMDQRAGRIYRIGSNFKNVYILNLATKNTIDESIIRTQKRKKAINKVLIG